MNLDDRFRYNLPDGFASGLALHLCRTCGAAVGVDYLERHNDWHNEMEANLESQKAA